MKNGKCKLCGKYEMREKEIGMKKMDISDEITIPMFRYWKWCKLKNNWCKSIAGKCGEIILRKNGNPAEFENKQGFDFKITIEDEL